MVRNGKGGRERLSPIVGKNAEQIVERIRNIPDGEKVWQHVHKCADIHAYRAEYATDIYRKYARPIEEIPYDKVNKGTGQAVSERSVFLQEGRSPARNWTRWLCWYAVRLWDITGLV